MRRKTWPSASSDRAIFHRTNPLQLVGLTRRRNPPGEQPGSMTGWIAPAGATEGRHLGLLRRRHPSRDGGSTQPRPRREARRSSERAARETRSGDRGVRGQDRNVFRFFETCRNVSSGAITPIEKRRSGRSELGRRETSGSSSREWPLLLDGRNTRREPRTRVGDWIGSRWQKSVGRNRGMGSKNRPRI
jgi:hypothetical protein